MPHDPVRVLVVEDDEDSFVVTRELLREVPDAQYLVDWAPDYDEAIRALQDQRYDICLADYHLGRHNGAELIGHGGYDGDETPVVVYSGSTGLVDLPSIRAGAGDFLPKMRLTSGALHRSLQYTLERHQLLKRLRQQRLELLASEARLRAVVDNALDGVVVLDRRGEVVFANPETTRAWGEGLGELIEAFVQRPAQDAMVELTLPLVGVERRVAEVRGHAVEWQGQPATILSIRDVTGRRALEEQLRQAQKMEAVGRLTGGIAHDLNNILTIILSNATLLEPTVSLDGRDDLSLVKQAASRGADLIRKLLVFSRRETLSLQQLDPTALSEEFRQLSSRLLPASIQIEVKCASGLGPMLADPGAVMQILLNLATNSRDAMPNGGTLTLLIEEVSLGPEPAAHLSLAAGRYLALTVADTGCGMDGTTQDHVFEPFFTTKEVGAGSGLGLPMVYGLVRQQQGALALESAVGQGTQVRVYLPRAHDGLVTEGPVVPSISPQPGTGTVLLVEDESGLRRSARRILERAGYRVLEAGNGAEGLALLATRHTEVDLVISDVVMPVMGGRDFSTAIGTSWPGLAILLTTGYAQRSPEDPALEGSLPILRKPWDAAELVQQVQEILQRHRADRA